MMTINDSLFHLYEKIKADPSPKPEEVEAINSMIEWVNNQKKEAQQDRLTAKLYVLYFNHLVLHYKDLEYAQQAIQRELQNPLAYHIEIFQNHINTINLENYLKSIGVSSDRWWQQTQEEQDHDNQLMNQHFQEIQIQSNRYTFEYVVESLNTQISETINKFKAHD